MTPDYEQQATDEERHRERIAHVQYVVVAWGSLGYYGTRRDAEAAARQDRGVAFARVDPPPGSMPVKVDAAEFHRVVAHCEELQRELRAKHAHHAATCEALRKCQAAYTDAAEARDRANMRANRAAAELVRLRDLLNTTLTRLRRVEQGGAGMAEVKAEVKRTADQIAANIDRKGAGE